MGTKNFQKFSNAINPSDPKKLSYKNLLNLADGILEPKSSIIAEQHKFSKRVQHLGESITSYTNDLKKLSKNCKFICPNCKASTADTHLRQQFISGIDDTNVLAKLIECNENKSFSECVTLASVMERAKNEAKFIQNSNKGVNAEIEKISEAKYNRNPKERLDCYRCGRNHSVEDCPFKNFICRSCNRRGHLQSVCRSKKKNYAGNMRPVQSLGDEEVSTEETANELTDFHQVFALPEVTTKPGKIIIVCKIEGTNTEMEFDSGAAVSIMSEALFNKICPHKKLQNTKLKLKTYTGEIISPVGYATVNFVYKEQSAEGNIYVISGNFGTMFGREWMRLIKFNFSELGLNRIQQDFEGNSNIDLKKLTDEYSCLFSSGVGRASSFVGKLSLSKESRPIFRPPRPVPYAIREKVNKEIDRLEKEGIISKVTYSEWGTPIVPVIKPNGDIRLCADYKTTINQFLLNDPFPIPSVEHILASLSEGKYFTSLDISQAYLHIPMDEESTKMQAISTQKGVYVVNRLMFGVKAAPGIWQRFITQTLDGIPGITIFFDDIKVQAATIEEHLRRLRLVFARLKENNIRLNKNKCQFLKESIKYLGHIISSDGIKTDPEKLEAIQKAPRPANVDHLRSWLGLINYYGRFLPNLATTLSPLYNLLKKGTKFIWNEPCETAYCAIKKLVMSEHVLVPYNPSLPLVLATDASAVGLGAVLSHIMPDGSERPIAYASRALTAAEQNYSQLDREATGIFWGVKKFFNFCFGRKFTLVCDNKPLISIFGSDKCMPSISAQRLIRYSIFLQGFDFDIQYKKTKEHGNADALSRLPICLPEEMKNEDKDEIWVLQMQQINKLPVDKHDIARETSRDPLLKDVYSALFIGGEIRLPAFKGKGEFSLIDGCIMRGEQVVIPAILRKRVLDELHEAHVGMVKMKVLARSYVWWPNINADIEELARSCKSCAENQASPPKDKDHPWIPPTQPWQRVHLDYAGPFRNKYFLVVVDAYTKWLEVIPVNSPTTTVTIENLRNLFARFGIPATIVTDNGTCFTSGEFAEYLRMNRVAHKTTAVCHPSSNGQAERSIRTVKSSLKKMEDEPGSLNLKLNRFLIAYRRSVHMSTNVSPAEMMYGRKLRSLLDLMKPMEFENNSEVRKEAKRAFRIGDKVMVKDYRDRFRRWVEGKISKRIGAVMYLVEVKDGQSWRRHVDQIRPFRGEEL